MTGETYYPAYYVAAGVVMDRDMRKEFRVIGASASDYVYATCLNNVEALARLTQHQGHIYAFNPKTRRFTLQKRSSEVFDVGSPPVVEQEAQAKRVLDTVDRGQLWMCRCISEVCYEQPD